MNPRPHLNPLTGLRFFAALLVVFYHCRNPFSEAALFQLPGPVLEIINAGFVGVGLFFILSGFILAYNYHDQDFRLAASRRDFWVARLARIYPVYLLGLVVAAPKFASGLWTEHRAVGPAVTDFAMAGASVFSLAQAWFLGKALQWNGPGWSLSAEAFFYLTFPFLLILFRGLTSKRSALIGILACWAVAMVPPSIYHSFVPEPVVWKDFIRFNPLVRLPEFVLGIFLGKLFLAQLGQGTMSGSGFQPDLDRQDACPTRGGATGSAPSSGARASWAVIATSVAVLTALAFQDHLPRYLLHNGLLAGLFAALVLSLAWTGLERTRVSRVLSAPTLVLLGEASYAVYILHIPLQKLFLGFSNKLWPGAFQGPWATSITFLAYLVITIGVSILSFKVAEVPGRRLIKQWFTRTRRDPQVGRRRSDLVPGLGLEEPIKQP